MPITFPGAPARPYLYLPDGWDQGWAAAKANAASAFGSVAFIGDSLTAGYNSSAYLSKSFRALVRAGLIGRGLPLGGDYYGCSECIDFEAQYAGTPPWVVTTVSRTWFSWGFGRLVGYAGGAGVGSVTFVTPYACTEIDILYYCHTGVSPTWQYTVDGGAAVVVT